MVEVPAPFGLGVDAVEEEPDMGFGDMVNKAKQMAGQHSDKVDGALDKGSEFIKGKTPDQHDGKVDQAADKARDFLNVGSEDDAARAGDATPNRDANPAAAPRDPQQP